MNQSNINRRWIHPSNSFKLTTYNILSQDLIELNRQLYKDCVSEDIEWRNRFNLLQEELSQFKSNIICLQEVNEDNYDDEIGPLLQSLEYNVIYRKRHTRKDGCLVAYDSSVELIRSNWIELGKIDRDVNGNMKNVAIFTLFKFNGVEFVVVTTHISFSPRRGEVKLNQIRLILAELTEFLDGNSCPVIFAGDFNTCPFSPIYNFIVKGKLNPIGLRKETFSGQFTHKCSGALTTRDSFILKNIGNDSTYYSFNDEDELSHPYTFVPIHPCVNVNQEEYVSAKNTDLTSLVDYIFVHQGHHKIRCLSYLELLTEDEYIKVGPVPNSICPSDHLPLHAFFIIE